MIKWQAGSRWNRSLLWPIKRNIKWHVQATSGRATADENFPSSTMHEGVKWGMHTFYNTNDACSWTPITSKKSGNFRNRVAWTTALASWVRWAEWSGDGAGKVSNADEGLGLSWLSCYWLMYPRTSNSAQALWAWARKLGYPTTGKPGIEAIGCGCWAKGSSASAKVPKTGNSGLQPIAS